MDQEFQTSFIPKKAATPKKVARVRRAPGALNVFAVVLFFAAVIAAAGVFVYKSSLEKRIIQMQDSLERAEDLFEPTLITRIQELDQRIDAAEDILRGHIAISPLFELLEEQTLPEIRYTELQYDIEEAVATGRIAIAMQGQAEDYEHIALQAELFSDNRFIKNPIFSSFSVNDEGFIDFELVYDVDSSLVSFQNVINRQELN